MKTLVYLCILILGATCLQAQELYVFSEPASNMPAKSVSMKVSAFYPNSRYNNFFKQRYMPEFMIGVNKNLMVHISSTFSDYYSIYPRLESGKLYVKYRFYSNDEVHRHFRLAAFADGSYTRSPFLYGELNLNGDNSGIQGGVIATQLINKVAVSATASVIKVFAEKGEHTAHAEHSTDALSYSVSTGYLLFPLKYTSYKQTNLNLYLELIGMNGLSKKHYMVDIAPALQIIFNSNLKINVGYRQQLKGNMLRVGEKTFVLGVERTFLGALKKRKK